MKLFQYLEEDAAWYERSQRLISLNYRAYRRMLRAAGFFPQTGSVLDVGCGTGFLSDWMPEAAYRGIDFNPAYIRYAETRRGTRFAVDDATALATIGERYDTVVAIGLLHHLDDDGVLAVLDQALRALQPDGFLYIIEALQPDPRNRVGRWLRNHDNGAWVRDAPAWGALFRQRLELSHFAACHHWPLDYLCLKGRPRALPAAG